MPSSTAGDNCPQVFNPTQSDVLELSGPAPVDGGSRNDGIGDACDLNPTVPDGHYHSALIFSPECIGSAFPFTDSDGDGWCDAEEGFLGSDPGNPASTPEGLAVPGTCSDGVDNDGDGLADLADTGCPLPIHDIGFKTPNPVVGPKIICTGPNPSNIATYTVKLKNVSGLAPEPAQLGILVKAVPGSDGRSGPAVTSVSGAAVTASGPINTDAPGFGYSDATNATDVEWLTKALVTVANNGNGNTNVAFTVTFPPCVEGTNVTPADYLVTVDVCHANDIAPLGLFGAGDCGAGGDGGQDRFSTNDAPVTGIVDDGARGETGIN